MQTDLLMTAKQLFSAAVLLIAFFHPLPVMSKTLRIATIEVAPFGFFTADKKPTGMMYEIGNLIAEEAGMAYTNKILPYARTPHVVISGEADFVLRYTNELLSNETIQVVSVIPMRNIVVGVTGVEYSSFSDLHGKTVASVRGAVFDDDFTADTQIIKNNTSDYIQGLKMLFNKRLDGIVGSRVGIYYTANKMGYSPEQFGIPLVLNTRHFWLHFSKKNADEKTITKLKAATIRLQEKGLIKKIIDKYMSQTKQKS